MLLSEIALASTDVAATSSRLAKIERLAGCLEHAAPDEVAIAVAYLSGVLPQGTVGVGWAALRDLPAPAGTPTLGLLEVDAAITVVFLIVLVAVLLFLAGATRPYMLSQSMTPMEVAVPVVPAKDAVSRAWGYRGPYSARRPSSVSQTQARSASSPTTRTTLLPHPPTPAWATRVKASRPSRS